MKRTFRRGSRFFLPVVIVGALCLTASSAIFFYKGKDRLNNLIEHGAAVKSTTVYSRYWPLEASQRYTWNYLRAVLRQLEYEEMSGPPTKPGQFNAFYPTLVISLRPFAYAEASFPTQTVRLHFEDQRLADVQAPTPPPIEGPWRLEPKELARWSTVSSGPHHQVRLAELPAYIPETIVAMEDKRFYEHGAFDLLGVLRALVVDLRHGHLRQGASTISQQLARSIFLSSRRTWGRKVMEAVFAVYLEARFTKAQLLEMYLNQVYWGQDGGESLIGLEAACRAYFNKPARELSVAEAAVLAGLLQSPNRYSPRTNPDVALDRRNVVLRLMFEQRRISAVTYQKAQRQPLEVIKSQRKANEAAYFLATLSDELEQRSPNTALSALGWSIFTTLDPVLQHAAVEAMRPPAGQGAIVVLDPASSAVLAWVGGSNYLKTPFDRAARAHRQPGSAFKPFVMLSALDRRVATVATLLKDEPVTIKTGKGPWTPQNYDKQYRKQATLWDSLVYSLNVPTVDLAMRVGLETVADYARRAGIQSPINLFPSMALGASEVTVPEIANAYATLATGGIYNPVFKIEAIGDGEGHIIEQHALTPQQTFDAGTVALVTQMLQAVLTEGTARPAKEMGFDAPAAGKTGTSENFQDAWFVGYTPTLVAAVWVGHDRPKSLGRAAAGIALPIWVDFMKRANVFIPAGTFNEPAGIVRKAIDPQTGFLVRSGCPSRREFPFLSGTEPTQECPEHAGGILGFFKRFTTKAPAPTTSH